MRNYRAMLWRNIPTGLCFLFYAGILIAALPVSGEKKPPQKPVDINRAMIAELQQVPGIGPRIAEAIVHLRERSGPYKRIEDLLAIRGISHDRLEKMRPYLTVGVRAQVKPHANKAISNSATQMPLA